MAIITAFTLIRALSLFHLTLAFFFLTSPITIVEQNLVFLIGGSMHLDPPISAFSKPSASTAFLAVILAFLGLSDLTAVSLPDEIALPFWSAQTPVRLLFLFAITGYTYLFKPGGALVAKGAAYRPGPGDELKNSLVFSWGFLELAMWYWVFLSLRDERRQKAEKVMEKRRAEFRN